MREKRSADNTDLYCGGYMEEQLEMTLKGGAFKKLMENRFAEIRGKYGLKRVEIEVLYFLAKGGEENTPTDAYRKLRINRGHVSQAIDSLCRQGYIYAMPDEKDRRIMHYSVSDAAKTIIADISEIRKKMDDRIFEGVTEEELKALKNVMNKIEHNIKKMLM